MTNIAPLEIAPLAAFSLSQIPPIAFIVCIIFPSWQRAQRVRLCYGGSAKCSFNEHITPTASASSQILGSIKMPIKEDVIS